ncbi:ABC transporter ATP-binding protein [Polynucleobacter rarus]|uniref:ABC transporter ATP-binding protein n=1 Tax=Polynucleobacter rarus TaxID=556055 RepID=UPI001B86065E|nr:ABC transporter ATP-binding protein [Polynucleobacter rarus]
MLNKIEQPTIVSLLKALWVQISQKRRKQLGLLLSLMILASFAEIISIGAVLPFLGVLTSPQRIYEAKILAPLIQYFNFSKAQDLVLPITILFSLAVIFAGALRLILLWASTKLSYAIGTDLSFSIFKRTIFQKYEIQVSRNSSVVINAITQQVSSLITILNGVLILLSSSVILSAIFLTLILIDPIVALSTFVGFGLIYILLIGTTRKKLVKNSKEISDDASKLIQVLQESLGGIREVLIDGTQLTFCNIYQKADLNLRRAQGNNLFIGQSPRYGAEALGMFLIAIIAYFLTQQTDGIAKAIPILGTLALGAQRLLPVLQQAYQSWTTIRGAQSSLADTLILLEQPLPQIQDRTFIKKMEFNSSIKFNNVSFQYGTNLPWVLKNVNLTIEKGSRVGFIGKTGSGKSTLLDLLMALLEATEGTLEIDGKTINSSNSSAWQSNIANVPQSIFLADSSIAENIAFGIPIENIDYQKVKKVAEQAQISAVIEAMPEQYKTIVGERGIRLSGGQRQRIGIARALYKGADVIIFDEATSALDTETEEAVMQAIENLNKNLTILIIAHRITTLKNCTKVIELGNNSIQRMGIYQEIAELEN